MMEETKYSHLGNSGEQQGVAVMPEDADGLHHSVVVNLPIEVCIEVLILCIDIYIYICMDLHFFFFFLLSTVDMYRLQ